jgi:hypothetical protein
MGENKINIASMHVSRNTTSQEALTILNVDTEVNESIVNLLLKVPEITRLKVVRL